MVSALDFRSEGRWFDALSLPSCCFLRQDTLPRIVSLDPGVWGGGVTLRWTNIPSRGKQQYSYLLDAYLLA